MPTFSARPLPAHECGRATASRPCRWSLRVAPRDPVSPRDTLTTPGAGRDPQTGGRAPRPDPGHRHVGEDRRRLETAADTLPTTPSRTVSRAPVRSSRRPPVCGRSLWPAARVAPLSTLLTAAFVFPRCRASLTSTAQRSAKQIEPRRGQIHIRHISHPQRRGRRIPISTMLCTFRFSHIAARKWSLSVHIGGQAGARVVHIDHKRSLLPIQRVAIYGNLYVNIGRC